MKAIKIKTIVTALMVTLSLQNVQSKTSPIDKFDDQFSIEAKDGARLFAPTEVWTDGKKVWIKFKSQDTFPLILNDNDEKVKFTVDYPYVIVEKLYPYMKVKTAGQVVSEITYQGRYSTSPDGIKQSQSKPSAVNAQANLPKENVADETGESVSFLSEKKPVYEKNFVVNEFIPPETGVIKSLDLSPEKSQQTKDFVHKEEVSKSIFIDYRKTPGTKVTAEVKEHIASGGKILLIGMSSNGDEIQRLKVSEKRCERIIKYFERKGVNKNISCDTTSDNTGQSGYNIIFKNGV